LLASRGDADFEHGAMISLLSSPSADRVTTRRAPSSPRRAPSPATCAGAAVITICNGPWAAGA